MGGEVKNDFFPYSLDRWRRPDLVIKGTEFFEPYCTSGNAPSPFWSRFCNVPNFDSHYVLCITVWELNSGKFLHLSDFEPVMGVQCPDLAI